jgi:hypothetical protein
MKTDFQRDLLEAGTAVAVLHTILKRKKKRL